jgi:hypothetical protein
MNINIMKYYLYNKLALEYLTRKKLITITDLKAHKAKCGSTAVEPMPNHPKAEGPAAATAIGIKHRQYSPWYQLFGVKRDETRQIGTKYQRF